MTIDADTPLAEPLTATPKRPVRWPGRTALTLGILTLLAAATGVGAASADHFELATIAAWTAIGASIVAVLGGVAAAIGNWDRGAAISGVVFGVLGNPLVLLYGLDAVGSW